MLGLDSAYVLAAILVVTLVLLVLLLRSLGRRAVIVSEKLAVPAEPSAALFLNEQKNSPLETTSSNQLGWLSEPEKEGAGIEEAGPAEKLLGAVGSTPAAASVTGLAPRTDYTGNHTVDTAVPGSGTATAPVTGMPTAPSVAPQRSAVWDTQTTLRSATEDTFVIETQPPGAEQSPAPKVGLRMGYVQAAGDPVRALILSLLKDPGELSQMHMRRLELYRPQRVIEVMEELRGELPGKDGEAKAAQLGRIRQYVEALAAAPNYAGADTPRVSGESMQAGLGALETADTDVLDAVPDDGHATEALSPATAEDGVLDAPATGAIHATEAFAPGSTEDTALAEAATAIPPAPGDEGTDTVPKAGASHQLWRDGDASAGGEQPNSFEPPLAVTNAFEGWFVQTLADPRAETGSADSPQPADTNTPAVAGHVPEWAVELMENEQTEIEAWAPAGSLLGELEESAVDPSGQTTAEIAIDIPTETPGYLEAETLADSHTQEPVDYAWGAHPDEPLETLDARPMEAESLLVEIKPPPPGSGSTLLEATKLEEQSGPQGGSPTAQLETGPEAGEVSGPETPAAKGELEKYEARHLHGLDIEIKRAEDVLALPTDQQGDAVSFLEPTELERIFGLTGDRHLKMAVVDRIEQLELADALRTVRSCLNDEDPELLLHALGVAERLLDGLPNDLGSPRSNIPA